MIPGKTAFFASVLLAASFAATLSTTSPARADDDNWRGDRDQRREWQEHQARERWEHDHWERVRWEHRDYPPPPRVVYVQPPQSGFNIILPIHID